MQFRKTTTTPKFSYEDLPPLPTWHTREELLAWRAAVAALPARVIVPALSENPTPAEERQQRLLGQIETEQRMQAEAHRIATDPREIQKREDLARIKLGRINYVIARLEVDKAELIANNPGLTS